MKRIFCITLLTSFILTGTCLASQQRVWKGHATLVIKKQHLQAFKRAVAKITEPTRKEEGCIFYEGYQLLDENGDETNIFEFHEIWESKEAMLIDHKEKSEHMKQFFKEIKANTKDSFLKSFNANGKYVYQVK